MRWLIVWNSWRLRTKTLPADHWAQSPCSWYQLKEDNMRGLEGWKDRLVSIRLSPLTDPCPKPLHTCGTRFKSFCFYLFYRKTVIRPLASGTLTVMRALDSIMRCINLT